MGALATTIGEIISWLEQQVRQTRDEQARNVAQLDQLRRQVHELADQVTQAERSVREIDPKLIPYKGLPEKTREIEEGNEQIRQNVVANKAEIENVLRVLRAEASYDREERSEASKRLEATAAQVASFSRGDTSGRWCFCG